MKNENCLVTRFGVALLHQACLNLPSFSILPSFSKKEHFGIISKTENIRIAETIIIKFHRRQENPLLNERDSPVPLY